MNPKHKDKLGALMGSLDWSGEMKLILKEARYGTTTFDRSSQERQGP